tara:strand:+ start:458 stop:3466 length:3009 start_codon:yes stop_codon:yes gene_type:complete
MADTRGTWSLSEAWAEKSAAEWVPISDVWIDNSLPQNTTAGYYIGGSTNSPYVAMSNIDKLTYANDTISTPPSASGFGRYTAPAPYNYYDNITVSNNGAFALFTNYRICNTPTPAPVMYKHDFSTDDVATVPSLAPVFPGAGGEGGAGTGETSWWHASTGNFGSYACTKITYATESYTLLPASTGFSSNGVGSYSRIFQNQLVAGYTPASATSNPGASQCKKLTFATDTFTDNGWTLNSNRNAMAAVDAGSDDNTGLVAGGSQSPSPRSDAVEKITFNSSTVSSAPSLPAGRYAGAAHSSGSGGSGYFSAMSTGSITADISKVPFSSYSFSNIPATTSSIRRNCKGYSGLSKALKAGMSAPVERWFDNGSEPPNTAYGTHSNWTGSIYKFDFASTTLSLPFGTISAPAVTNGGSQRYRAASMSSSSAGYISGGNTYVTPQSAVNTQNKITYATDVNANLPGSNIGDARWGHAGISDATAGWYLGGNTGSSSYNRTHIYKTTFATDAVTTSPAQMTAGSYMISATNSAFAGYTFGGQSYQTSSQKLTFATESCILLPAVMPSVINVSGSSTGTQTAGYVTAGSPGNSIVAKMTWATETSANIPSTLTSARSQTYAVGNTTDGFFGGGSPGGNARIDNINYSTETIAVVPSWSPSPMYTNSYYGTGTGARNKGVPVNLQPTATPTPSKAPGPSFDGALWMGGQTTNGTTVSSGGKIDFSTDTVTELASTHLSGNRYNLAATSSIEAGYYGNAQTTEVVKVNYGTETPSVLPGGISGGGEEANDPRRRGAAFGPKTEGYMMQGSTGSSGSLSNFDRIVYSTEVISRLPGSNCLNPTYASCGTSNQTTGYLNAGAGGSTCKKIPFSTLSWSNIPGANFNAWDAKTFSNTTHGFWIGGKVNGAGSEVHKLTYSNDTAARLPGSNHPWLYQIYGWGSGNSTYGWTSGGGFNPGTSYTTSNFYKMAYSNDTWSTSPSTTSNRKAHNAAAGARQNGMGASQVTGATPVLI